MEAAVYTLVEAGAVLGLGRSRTFDLARRGQFPVPVLMVGGVRKVSKQAVSDFLGQTERVAS